MGRGYPHCTRVTCGGSTDTVTDPFCAFQAVPRFTTHCLTGNPILHRIPTDIYLLGHDQDRGSSDSGPPVHFIRPLICFLRRFLRPDQCRRDFIIIIIIIIIFINCNWVVTRWQCLFYMYTEYEIGYY